MGSRMVDLGWTHIRSVCYGGRILRSWYLHDKTHDVCVVKACGRVEVRCVVAQSLLRSAMVLLMIGAVGSCS